MREPTDVGRFWEKVNGGGGNECWEWNAYTGRDGYGRFRLNGTHELAHRVSYLLESGQDPADGCVLHTCDNPPCVNPDHLYLGDHSDNAQDREDRGRGRHMKGEASGTAKLTREDVVEIKESLDGNLTQAELADEFGVSHGTVNNIALGKTWGHV